MIMTLRYLIEIASVRVLVILSGHAVEACHSVNCWIKKTCTSFPFIIIIIYIMTILRVGVIGAGEVSQVIHLPTLTLLRDLFRINAICDVSKEAVLHAQEKFNIPFGCTNSTELVSRKDIDLVVVASADEFHAQHAIEAADAGKHVLIEKPMTLLREEAKDIEDAGKRNKVHIFIGYMRRYTTVWSTFLDELDKAGTINFARVFDYSGPNSTFVGQSSTMPKVFMNDIPDSVRMQKTQRALKIAESALGKERAQDSRLTKVFRLLGSLGSHDISCMRHAFGGVPDSCTTAFASPSGDFVGATFMYNKQPNLTSDKPSVPFQVSYETGIHEIGTFDAYIEVYCQNAVVRLDYDTPYVKGLPIHVTVRSNCGPDGRGYEERKIRPTFVDAYSAEFIRLHSALHSLPVNDGSNQEQLLRQGWGKANAMCGPEDAVKDLDIFHMIMRHLL